MAEETIRNDASLGLATSRDPSSLGPGELTVATACEYRVGSPHLYKLPGRSSSGATLGGDVLALEKLQYDSADDVLVADAAGTIWESEASLTPTFTSSGVTGLSPTAVPHYTGFRNTWIRCNGDDDNYLRESGDVPNGTQGNWRTVGMATALVPSLSSISYYTGGGETLRPTTYTNGISNPLGGRVPYHDPALAIDGPGEGTGTVSGAAGQQVITGVGTFFTTELSVGTRLYFTSTGETGIVLSIAAATQLTLEANLVNALSGSDFTYTGSTTSPAPESTRAWASTGDANHTVPGTSIPIFPRIATCTWNFGSNLSATGRVLSVIHNGACSPPDQAPTFGPEGMTFAVEYSLDAGSTWLDLNTTHQPFTNVRTNNILIDDSVNTTNLRVRATITANTYQRVSNHWLDVTHAVYDITVSTGTSGAYIAQNDIYYGISEVYTDSDGVEHQSNMGTQIGQGGTLSGLYIGAASLQEATSVTLNLPAKINPLATQFIIWRSVDTPGGGFPVMYEIDRVATTATQYIDLFKIRPDDTAALATRSQYKILEVLYSDGSLTLANYYTQPPLSFMTLVFQGCLVYFPAVTAERAENARKIFYSLPATVSINALEQVPEQYFLDFQTPRNDQVKSGSVTNGGRSMLVFFENYTMLVNYLPQGADPGGFNNTVKEYVSDVRGCAGTHACTEFTLPSGQTLVASVDGLGLWVTNGVNLVEEWTNDIDWPTLIEGVTLSDVVLENKPHKRRIEMLYTDANGDRQEMHFFYGRMKQSPIDGKTTPLITGPHPSGCRSKHYTMIDGQWCGFGGDASAVGNVFLEDDQAADDSHGYDATGIVPWAWTFGDLYVGGEGQAHILERAQAKFSDTPTKAFEMTITFIRDSNGVSSIQTKTMGILVPNQIYLHRYADRHRVGFSDLTNTVAPAFVEYVVKTRPAGPERDR